MEKNMDKCGLLKSFWTNQIMNNQFDNKNDSNTSNFSNNVRLGKRMCQHMKKIVDISLSLFQIYF